MANVSLRDIVKARGGSLCHPLDTFDVSLAPDAPARLLRVADTRGEAAGWALRAFDPGPGLVGAVAIATTGEKEEETLVGHD